MPGQPPSRTLRYSRQPSLSTINSCEEANFNSASQPREAPLSPYTGGGTARNSVVSALSQQDHFFESTNGVYRTDPYYYGATTATVEASKPSEARIRTTTSQLDSQMTMPQTEEGWGKGNEKAESVMDSTGKIEMNYYPRTRWIWMLLQLDEIPFWHNVVTSFCTWIILAAYLIFPGTFTSLKSTQALNQASAGVDKVGYELLMGIDHIGLLAASCILASVGAFGCFFMWIANRKNYCWLCSKIFMPITLNSLAGLLTTIINVNTAQKKIWSVTAVLNAIISGSVTGIAGLVYCIYFFFLLRPIKKEHERIFPPEVKLTDLVKERKGMRRMRKWFS